ASWTDQRLSVSAFATTCRDPHGNPTIGYEPRFSAAPVRGTSEGEKVKTIPNNFKDAMGLPEAKLWKGATDKEMKSLQDRPGTSIAENDTGCFSPCWSLKVPAMVPFA
ncbi:unnamed protein product, partial [Ectocarpus sp. 12 AP-2014]